MKRIFLVSVLLVLQACAAFSETQRPGESYYVQELASILDSTPAAGAVIVIDAPGTANDLTAAAGFAGPGRPMQANHPVRIASITKTYVAAAVLRLLEEGELELDAPVVQRVSAASSASLREAGHSPGVITVRHLLSHTAGLPDHADEAYLGQVLEDSSRNWSRDEQIALLAEGRPPVGEPGKQYVYSDTGYVLLGEIIERTTGRSLASAVRELLRLNEIDLEETWWEMVEKPTPGAPERAVQTLSGRNINQWSGTIDLYGGGGIIASANDMARFYSALFAGDVFASASTLDLMLASDSVPVESPYRLGVFSYAVEGVPIYEHSGFWGTHVLHAPSLGLSVSGVVLDQAGYRPLRDLMRSVVRDYAP